MPAKPKDRIKRLFVDTEQGRGGELVHESRFVFNCASDSAARAVSLSMPPQAQSYTDSTLFPVFAMSRPEGWLAVQIAHRLARHVHLDDMRLLALVGHNLIGRLSFVRPDAAPPAADARFGLGQILEAHPTNALFDAMAEVYFASGVSGVQPKVLVPDADAQALVGSRATALQPDLIVKSGGVEY
ncbi:MAG: HipA N-terminal domain-containing protein, partial [Betaproteobacteria bacterium]|nr:HipA N-terminal domain-containing protein [Betaproteobacteria bacterium]